MRKKLLVYFIFLLPSISFPQGSITGKILDQGKLNPLGFASIALYTSLDSSLINGGITDESGRFELNQIGPGNYFIIASFIGFQSKTLLVANFRRNERLDLGEIQLNVDQVFLGEVEVKGEKFTSNFQVAK